MPPQTAADLLADDPSITVVDARTPAEFAEAHLDGGILTWVDAGLPVV